MARAGSCNGFAWVQCPLATNQEEVQEECTNCVKDLFDYVNKEITTCKHSFMPLGVVRRRTAVDLLSWVASDGCKGQPNSQVMNRGHWTAERGQSNSPV